MTWRYAIKHIADMVVRGYPVHTKECLGVVPPHVLVQRPLKRQKRRLLHEKYRESPHANILHEILAVTSCALVGHSCERLAQMGKTFLQKLHIASKTHLSI